MTDTIKTFYQGAIATSVGTVWTSSDTFGSIVKSILIVNSGASCTFQLFKKGTAAGNAITPAGWSIPANGMAQLSGETIGFANGDTLAAVASAATLTMTVDGDGLS